MAVSSLGRGPEVMGLVSVVCLMREENGQKMTEVMSSFVISSEFVPFSPFMLFVRQAVDVETMACVFWTSPCTAVWGGGGGKFEGRRLVKTAVAWGEGWIKY